QDGSIVDYTIDNANNFLRNNIALNTADQDVICTGGCFNVNNLTVTNPSTASQIVVSTQATVQNLHIQTRVANRTVLEAKTGQSARYTIPSAQFNINGTRAFL
ncbi:MAG: hypothetical protein VKK59_04280, partial [Vampirovibrionales bacterium]|nr:hypothetical protein [Vampirovibrionales bacterium]